jgi:alkylation response protein AidB-like acyl-CoA dehydrogenase
LAKTVRDFARSVVAPVAAKHDAEHSFPYEVVAGMADMGLSGCRSPRSTAAWVATTSRCARTGGLRQDRPERRHHARGGGVAGRHAGYRFGNDAQKQEWLPLLASGKALGAFGLTEAGGGTDAGATRTTAKLDDALIINGPSSSSQLGTDITKLVTVTAVTGEQVPRQA